MTAPLEASIFDFAPHVIHYAGSFGARTFVSLMQYPLLLVIDDEGNVVHRVAIPDVDRVVGGKIAVRSSLPRVRLANVQREPDRDPVVPVAHDVATGRELCRGKEAVDALLGKLDGDSADSRPVAMLRDGNIFSWSLPHGGPSVRIAMHDNDRKPGFRWDWGPTRVQDDAFVLEAPTRLLRIPFELEPETKLVARTIVPDLGDLPLEPAVVFFAGPERVLVEHATRGRLWFDLPNSGLAKGDEVRVGGFLSDHEQTTVPTVLVREGRELLRREPTVRATSGELVVIGERAPDGVTAATKEAPEALVRCAEVLADHGLIERLSRADLSALFRDELEDEVELGVASTAEVLLTVYAATSGVARGVVHHDHRFGNETDDVVAELSATLGDEPVAFRQVGARDDALQIEVGGRKHWVSFDRGGLDAIAHWMNVRLEEAGARRRIFSVETSGDETCYVVCTPDAVEAMKARGLTGFGAP